jgi:uncharacterized protein (UPF0216 family)
MSSRKISNEIIRDEEKTIAGDIKTVIKHIEEKQCATELLKAEERSLIAEFKGIGEVKISNELKSPILTNLCLALGLNTGETQEGTLYQWPDCKQKGTCPICDETARRKLETTGLMILKMMLAEQEGKRTKIGILDTGDINEMLARIGDKEEETVMKEVAC